MPLNLWTIAPEEAFLPVLAQAVLRGFPLENNSAGLPLTAWTILLPTRRAARRLEDILLTESGKKALLLPRIRPIGDLDEDLLEESLPEDGVPDAITSTGQLYLILSLVKEWVATHPEHPLAQEIRTSPSQCFQLALSLQQLVTQSETEETGFAALREAYDLDLAGHREAILGLMAIVSEKLPARLQSLQLMGPAARRNLMIRLEADRIRSGVLKGPIVAAGSTGTNPATRDLLLAIASAAQGAVLLPGLDLALDDEAWSQITQEHPQYAMKVMLEAWGMARQDVKSLGSAAGKRSWLARVALRPAAASDGWPAEIAKAPWDAKALLDGLSLVQCATRHEEALVIALRLRQHSLFGTGRAALITPDRDLAKRVTVALQRWSLEIDDSGGEALSRSGLGLLLVLLLEAVDSRFTPQSLMALLHHADVTLGLARKDCLRLSQLLELVCFRGQPTSPGFGAIRAVLSAFPHSVSLDPHAHPLLKAALASLPELQAFVARIESAVAALLDEAPKSLASHIENLLAALVMLAPEATEAQEQSSFRQFLDGLAQASPQHPVVSLAEAQHSIRHALQAETSRVPLRDDAPLVIYGLLEARLMDVELAILGGLTEGTWPDLPDTGPWLNRSMRATLGLQQPERSIGLMAHDFTQALGARQVMLTWPRRKGKDPVQASRWVTRLRALLRAMGLADEDQLDETLPKLARRLDQPQEFAPISRPQARPPVDLRPRAFSVSSVEKLVRDSYAIYARDILKLEPLPLLYEFLSPALRGTLVHEALKHWASGENKFSLERLLEAGEQVFAPYASLPEVTQFWLPRFRRTAKILVQEHEILLDGVLNTLTEVSGSTDLSVGGQAHRLRARADRIDVLHNGTLRIIDYKTGKPPTDKEVAAGFAPQLTLEAVIAAEGGFKSLGRSTVSEATYIKVSAGKDAVTLTPLHEDFDISATALKHKAELLALLTAYQDVNTAYIPRHNLQRENQPSDYDHLSRRLEWEMKGKA